MIEKPNPMNPPRGLPPVPATILPDLNTSSQREVQFAKAMEALDVKYIFKACRFQIKDRTYDYKTFEKILKSRANLQQFGISNPEQDMGMLLDLDRKSTRLNSSHSSVSRMPSSA